MSLLTSDFFVRFLHMLTIVSFPVYQTGSREFGTAHELSDWDFFVKNEKLTCEAFMVAGFKPIQQSHYNKWDGNTAFVLRRVFPTGIQVDVQFVNDVDLKWTAQEYIQEHKMLLERMPFMSWMRGKVPTRIMPVSKDKAREVWKNVQLGLAFDAFLHGKELCYWKEAPRKE